MTITKKLHPKNTAKLLLIAYTLSMATYGSIAAYHNLNAYTGRQLNAYAVSRVQSKGLGAVTIKEVPVITTDQAASIVGNAAENGANKAITSHLSK